jgi:hypothetical protein
MGDHACFFLAALECQKQVHFFTAMVLALGLSAGA